MGVGWEIRKSVIRDEQLIVKLSTLMPFGCWSGGLDWSLHDLHKKFSLHLIYSLSFSPFVTEDPTRSRQETKPNALATSVIHENIGQKGRPTRIQLKFVWTQKLLLYATAALLLKRKVSWYTLSEYSGRKTESMMPSLVAAFPLAFRSKGRSQQRHDQPS